MKCSSSATFICNHALLPQLKADRSMFCTYSLTMEGAHLTYYRHIQSPGPLPLASDLQVRRLSYSTSGFQRDRASLCTMPHIAAVEGEGPQQPLSWLSHPNGPTAPCCYRFSVPRNLTCRRQFFFRDMAFVQEIPAVTYSTPIKVSTMIMLCLSDC